MKYVVKQNDSLYLIAKKFNMSVEKIMKLNNLINDKLKVGQVLIIAEQTFDGMGKDENQGIYSEVAKEAEQIAVFKDWRVAPKPNHRTDVDIYIHKAAIFYMSKMAIDEGSNTSLGFVDTNTIPFLVLPKNTNWAKLGDFGIVINTVNWKSSFAIFADWGKPHNKEENTVAIKSTLLVGTIGEGSYELARRLDIDTISQNGEQAYQPDNIIYIVFPNSGNGERKSVGQIEKAGKNLFDKWGGNQQLKKHVKSCYNKNWGE
ncbi:MAG: LysM peptidoglycan-binding domain-containing protein [Bacillota bacterium]|nr:LysM peptidoglycan-binding domain-containing protein [Bacillota bacterium]